MASYEVTFTETSRRTGKVAVEGANEEQAWHAARDRADDNDEAIRWEYPDGYGLEVVRITAVGAGPAGAGVGSGGRRMRAG